MSDVNFERDSFEAWYIAGLRKAVPAFAKWSDIEIREGCMRPEKDSYRIDSARIALQAWQARAALADASAPLEKLRINPESEPVAKYVYGEKTALLDVVALSLTLESAKKQLSASPAAVPVVLPEPDAVIEEVMGIVNDAINSGIFAAWCKESADSRMDEAKHEHNSDIDAIESKLRALLATDGQAQADARDAERYLCLKAYVKTGSIGFGDSWISAEDMAQELDEFMDSFIAAAKGE